MPNEECPACGRPLRSFISQPHDVTACRSAHTPRPDAHLAEYAAVVAPNALCATCGMVHPRGSCQ